ncbi:MAG: DUF4430 domain-containing protein [Thermoleophilaceae bacterium]|nr:DUF4430 domain-containing protein [Thermoleophilaceae bacterium]
MPLPRPALAALLAACAFLGAGCGGSGTAGPATSVTITRDFGASVIAQTEKVEATSGLTALRQLETVHKVTTGYGGRYVKSIDDTAEDSDSSWLFFVDGIESPVGATSTRLKPKQVVQWDFHAWENVRTGGAIVGAYPLPLKKRGVRVICVPRFIIACRVAREGLTAAGVVVNRRGPDKLIVGEWNSIQGLDGVPDLTLPGDTNGAYAQFTKNGRTLIPYSADGSPEKGLINSSALLAAFANPDGVVWVATGTDEDAASSAARLLGAEKGKLRNRFAMAIDNGREHALPLGAGR